ncbi:MAG: hypothetical protein PVJ42_00750 [bacterium]|jgi:hypothetical protein
MKTRTYILPALLLLLALTAACSKSTSEPEAISVEDLLVKNNELAGWVYGDERWVARNDTELFDIIDGAGEINIQNGFQEGAYQNYNGTINEESKVLDILIFDQGTSENAQTVYDAPETDFGDAVPWVDGAGEEAHYKTVGWVTRMSFHRGKYYVLLTVNSDAEEGLNILKQFALNVDGKILDNE